jgi:hypothetical protein
MTARLSKQPGSWFRALATSTDGYRTELGKLSPNWWENKATSSPSSCLLSGGRRLHLAGLVVHRLDVGVLESLPSTQHLAERLQRLETRPYGRSARRGVRLLQLTQQGSQFRTGLRFKRIKMKDEG